MSSNGLSQNATLEILRPRADWITRRKAEAARTGDTNVSQMHFARKGKITEEMAVCGHAGEDCRWNWCAMRLRPGG